MRFSNPPDTYKGHAPDRFGLRPKTAPTVALCGDGKYKSWMTAGTGVAARSTTCSSCCPSFASARSCTPKPLLTTTRYRPPPPGPEVSGDLSMVTGSDPSATDPSSRRTTSPAGSSGRCSGGAACTGGVEAGGAPREAGSGGGGGARAAKGDEGREK